MAETSQPLIVLLFRMSSDVWTNHDMTGEKMEKIKSVALLGAGAVGSYVFYGFSGCPDLRFSLVAEGARAERLKNDGCLINGDVYHPEVLSPAEAHGVDLLIVALKYGALKEALPEIRAVVGEHTTVMSLMNGVDSEDIIASAIGAEHMIYSMIKVASSRQEGRGCCFDPETTVGIIYGEANAPYESARIRAMEDVFGRSRLHTRHTDCIREEIWNKFRLNVCNNLPQAILGVGVGCYRDSAHMKAISDGLRHEVEQIAEARGVDMEKLAMLDSKGCLVSPAARYSTLQDLDAGRHTEIDMFSGTLMRMGEECGIPTPFNTCIYHLIKAREEKNDGLFDYEGKTDKSCWAK